MEQLEQTLIMLNSEQSEIKFSEQNIKHLNVY